MVPCGVARDPGHKQCQLFNSLNCPPPLLQGGPTALRSSASPSRRGPARAGAGAQSQRHGTTRTAECGPAKWRGPASLADRRRPARVRRPSGTEPIGQSRDESPGFQVQTLGRSDGCCEPLVLIGRFGILSAALAFPVRLGAVRARVSRRMRHV